MTSFGLTEGEMPTTINGHATPISDQVAVIANGRVTPPTGHTNGRANGRMSPPSEPLSLAVNGHAPPNWRLVNGHGTPPPETAPIRADDDPRAYGYQGEVVYGNDDVDEGVVAMETNAPGDGNEDDGVWSLTSENLDYVRSQIKEVSLSNLEETKFQREDVYISKYSEVVTERKVGDVFRSPAFLRLHQTMKWIHARTTEIEADTLYENETSLVAAQLERHRRFHETIVEFREKVDACLADRPKDHQKKDDSVTETEVNFYAECARRCDVSYLYLLSQSGNRLRHLMSLLDFLQTSSEQLLLMNAKEAEELRRDWSDAFKTDVAALEKCCDVVSQALRTQETSYKAVNENGESLVRDGHPASVHIKGYLLTMSTQWNWLLNLLNCHEIHKNHAIDGFNFYQDVKACDSWISDTNAKVEKQSAANKDVTLEDKSIFINETNKFEKDLDSIILRIKELAMLSKNVIPLQLRGEKMAAPLNCVANCSFKSTKFKMAQNDRCALLGTESGYQWRVRVSLTGVSGVESGVVPSVCLTIQPPNAAAEDAAKQLERRYKELKAKWKKSIESLENRISDLEAARLARLEAERQAALDSARTEQERRERLAAERAEAERLERERLEKERLERERLERERLERERLERERLERERLERERLEKERLEKERLEKERLEKERLEAERLEAERLAAELEAARLAALEACAAEEEPSFSYEDWKERYMAFHSNKRARVVEFFRKNDKDGDRRLTRKEFVAGMMASGFKTSEAEMEFIAASFDEDGNGFIDFDEFINALHPENLAIKKLPKEIQTDLNRCMCAKQFRVTMLSESKFAFGDARKTRVLRILRSSVMVREGGGWTPFRDFLNKMDPCRIPKSPKPKRKTTVGAEKPETSTSASGYRSRTSTASSISGVSSPRTTRSRAGSGSIESRAATPTNSTTMSPTPPSLDSSSS